MPFKTPLQCPVYTMLMKNVVQLILHHKISYNFQRLQKYNFVTFLPKQGLISNFAGPSARDVDTKSSTVYITTPNITRLSEVAQYTQDSHSRRDFLPDT